MQRLIETDITHVKRGGPPDGWESLIVVDVKGNTIVHQVYEVNTKEGWVDTLSPNIPEDRIVDTWPVIRSSGTFIIMTVVEDEEITR